MYRYDRKSVVQRWRCACFLLILALLVLLACNILLAWRLSRTPAVGSDPQPSAATLAASPLSCTASAQTQRPEPKRQETERTSLGVFTVTAYCSCARCCGVWASRRPGGIVYTASGTVAQEGRTVAVDPNVIPYGTVLWIAGHRYVAEDCGGAIKGNRIDVYFSSHDAARAWGVQELEVLLDE